MTVDPVAPFGAPLNHRILLVAEDGCVARMLCDGLERAGCVVTRAATHDEDLFARAADHDTIVYLPARSFLRASLGTEDLACPGVGEVLAAGVAPGVSLLVTVLPASAGPSIAEEAIQRSGIPYFVVRTPALAEELKVELAGEVPDTVWAPDCEGIALGDADTLLRAVLDCLVDERQGRTIELRATVTDVPTALRRALAGDERRVISVWPPIFQMGRVAARMMRGEDTPDVQLIDTLLAHRDAALTPPLRAA